MSAVAIATLIALMLKVVSAKGAALALVLAVDVSASVTADSYLLQRDGIARAFANPRLIEAITALPGGIEVLVLQWSDPDKIIIVVDWMRVDDAASAKGFAAAMRTTRRSPTGITAIGPALFAAAATFDHLPEPANALGAFGHEGLAAETGMNRHAQGQINFCQEMFKNIYGTIRVHRETDFFA